MTIWTLFLLSCCAAALLLAFYALVDGVRAMLQAKHKLNDLMLSPFFMKLESFQIQVSRLNGISIEAQSVSARINAAIESLRATVQLQGLGDARRAVSDLKSELTALQEALR